MHLLSRKSKKHQNRLSNACQNEHQLQIDVFELRHQSKKYLVYIFYSPNLKVTPVSGRLKPKTSKKSIINNE